MSNSEFAYGRNIARLFSTTGGDWKMRVNVHIITRAVLTTAIIFVIINHRRMVSKSFGNRYQCHRCPSVFSVVHDVSAHSVTWISPCPLRLFNVYLAIFLLTSGHPISILPSRFCCLLSFCMFKSFEVPLSPFTKTSRYFRLLFSRIFLPCQQFDSLLSNTGSYVFHVLDTFFSRDHRFSFSSDRALFTQVS